jgi:hypothetical protein
VSLHGTLETFALPDVMALLAATKKTGELRVVGGRLDGRVHLDNGQVVAMEVGRADSFVDGVFELLRLTTGKFSFDGDKRPSERREPSEVEPLLLEAQSRLAEWRQIETVVPSLEAGISLVGTLSDPHVTLAADQWRMVVAAASSRTVAEVADTLGLGEYGACKALKELVESGVVAIGPAPAPVAAPVTAPVAAPVVVPAPEPVAAEPAPVPQAAPEGRPEPESDPEPRVTIPALTTSAGPSSTPEATATPSAPKPKRQPKAEPAPAAVATAAEAKALVSELASLSADVAPKAAPAPAPASAPKAEPAVAATPEPAPAPAAEAPAAESPAAEPAAAEPAPAESGEVPLNRGLLLKFLSSVRQ